MEWVVGTKERETKSSSATTTTDTDSSNRLEKKSIFFLEKTIDNSGLFCYTLVTKKGERKMELTYKFEITYFVLNAETEETLATTKDLEVAKFLKQNYPTPSVVRPMVKAIAFAK